MPAAAVIREGRALFVSTGRKGFLGGFYVFYKKIVKTNVYNF